MAKTILKADKRTVEGRKVKRLRNEGILPGNVYGHKVKSESVQVNLKDFQVVFKEIGETGLLTLTLGSEEKPVLIHNLQVNPVSDEPIHVDFLQVNLKEKVEADIPVELSGESPAEKQGIGTVVLYVNEIKVEALPTDLPEKFEIDTTTLSEVDQAVTIADLKYDKEKVEIKVAPEEIVAKVEPPQKEEVVEAPAPAEGEAAAEGAAEGSSEGQTGGENNNSDEAPKE